MYTLKINYGNREDLIEEVEEFSAGFSYFYIKTKENVLAIERSLIKTVKRKKADSDDFINVMLKSFSKKKNRRN